MSQTSEISRLLLYHSTDLFFSSARQFPVRISRPKYSTSSLPNARRIYVRGYGWWSWRVSSSRRDASRQGNICKFGRANNLVSDTSRLHRMCRLIVIYRESRCLAETKVETACYRGNYRKGDRLGRSRIKEEKRRE